MEAIEAGDESGVKRCLDDGADAMFADEEGFTALHMACQEGYDCLLYTSPSPRDKRQSRMPSSA